MQKFHREKKRKRAASLDIIIGYFILIFKAHSTCAWYIAVHLVGFGGQHNIYNFLLPLPVLLVICTHGSKKYQSSMYGKNICENKLYKIDKRIVIISLPNFKTSKNGNNLLEIKEL